jgi:hypothetical protein
MTSVPLMAGRLSLHLKPQDHFQRSGTCRQWIVSPYGKVRKEKQSAPFCRYADGVIHIIQTDSLLLAILAETAI